ncbi:MAG: cyclic nucleotide-binding domain-containing protein [Clostridiales bacterium]|nr:cyclic nucleotide-binding domain-containing protein [Clostridiales bacterium]
MLEEENISKIINLQKSLSGDQKEYLNTYLSNAPRWLLESMQIIHKDKNSIFIKENLDVDWVYILVEGVVRAIDYRFFGIAYDYMWFYSIKVFGAMETLLNIERYKTTLMTVTPCTLITIPKGNFEKWMMNDIHAMRMEMESIGNYLLEQARKEFQYVNAPYYTPNNKYFNILSVQWIDLYYRSDAGQKSKPIKVFHFHKERIPMAKVLMSERITKLLSD